MVYFPSKGLPLSLSPHNTSCEGIETGKEGCKKHCPPGNQLSLPWWADRAEDITEVSHFGHKTSKAHPQPKHSTAVWATSEPKGSMFKAGVKENSHHGSQLIPMHSRRQATVLNRGWRTEVSDAQGQGGILKKTEVRIWRVMIGQSRTSILTKKRCWAWADHPITKGSYGLPWWMPGCCDFSGSLVDKGGLELIKKKESNSLVILQIRKRIMKS